MTFSDVNSHDKVVACYVAGWSAYRPGNGAFTVENIDPMLCTHIIYAFAGLDNVTYSIKSLDSFLDTEDDGGRGKLINWQYYILFSSYLQLNSIQVNIKKS